jgi:hypothetical protein
VIQRPLLLASREADPKAASGTAGPIGWWKCDETTGSTVANAAGTHYQGQVLGAARWGQGHANQCGALELDGARSWVECANSSDLDLRSGFTVSAWFKVRRFDRALQTLAAKGGAWSLHRESETNRIEFTVGGLSPSGARNNGGRAAVASKRAVDDDQWHLVTAVYEGKRIRLYLDGGEEGSLAVTGNLTLNNAPVTLGENDTERGRWFNGWVENVRVYDRALKPEETRSLAAK